LTLNVTHVRLARDQSTFGDGDAMGVGQYRDGLAKIQRRLAELEAMRRDLDETVVELRDLEQDALERIAKLEGAEPLSENVTPMKVRKKP
jgi:hypothetical protein